MVTGDGWLIRPLFYLGPGRHRTIPPCTHRHLLTRLPCKHYSIRPSRLPEKAVTPLYRQLNRVHELQIHTKARNEFVTQVDLAAEAAIIETISERYPDHGFLAEESGRRGDGDFIWVIDPLDGTTNFIHGFPIFAVSIALRVKGRIQVGVIYDPNRQELFTTIRAKAHKSTVTAFASRDDTVWKAH